MYPASAHVTPCWASGLGTWRWHLTHFGHTVASGSHKTNSTSPIPHYQAEVIGQCLGSNPSVDCCEVNASISIRSTYGSPMAASLTPGDQFSQLTANVATHPSVQHLANTSTGQLAKDPTVTTSWSINMCTSSERKAKHHPGQVRTIGLSKNGKPWR
jgi:hypothetical protein